MMLPQYELKDFDLHKDGTLVQEASCLRVPPGYKPRAVMVGEVVYTYYKTDVYNEDVAGWWLQSSTGQKMLIIND